MRIAIVQGTRPEIIKNYSVARALGRLGVQYKVLHTNQHQDVNMCSNVYADLGYEPDRKMVPAYRLGTAIDWLQEVFRSDRISCVIVNGDTASALAGTLAALYLDIPVSHIEAGLRSRDAFMLEERNRIMIDSVSSLLFPYTKHEHRLLKKSPDIRGHIFCEGNTTVDFLHDFQSKFSQRPLGPEYVYVTMHRKELTDSPDRMRTVFSVLNSLAEKKCKVVFPIHPRTKDAMRRWHIGRQALNSVVVLDPVTPFESIAFAKHARAVITDSGCLQEEAYLLGVPCVTVRQNTERHLTVLNGANIVTGFERASIIQGVEWALSMSERAWPDIFGSIGVGIRIGNRIVTQEPGKTTTRKAAHSVALRVRKMS